ncbi:MAG TPA: type IV toxin-antitoxin system AbiEi family antitoxin domain-containing protein [Acidimicrobiales bacterium]|nr:type IV toxin-antitoxin system AbiEi family antitoxin domain-containing protein [Acidimicrobiales bacterium]
MPAHPTLARLAPIAEDQWGLVTRRQAEDAGVSKATLTRLVGHGVLERVAHAVYRLTGVPQADHIALRAAWLQLAPEVPAWERSAEQGVVSHRSAAALYGLGELPADRHEFTLPGRKQSRRPDVRLHLGKLMDAEWISLRGLPVTRPSRIAADLLAEREDPGAVGRLVTDAIRGVFDYPGTFAETLAPFAAQLGLRRGDGLAALRWLLDLGGDRHAPEWLAEAQTSLAESTAGGDA